MTLDDGGDLRGVVVPDDARALAPDLRRLRRERRAAARARRRAGRIGPSALVAALLVAGAAVAGLVLALLTREAARTAVARPAPLAAPDVAPGAVGGLLPEVELAGRVRPEGSRGLRPGVVVLVAADCDCLPAVRQVARDAAPHGLVTYLVEAGDDPRQVEALAAQAGGVMAPLLDPAGVLARTYRLRSNAALVLVRADGVVTHVVDAVGASLDLRDPLRGLLAQPAQR